MTQAPAAASVLRFGRLTVDLRSQEAWKDADKLPIQQQPLQILAMLLERPGEVVTREQLRQRLWPDGTFVDFEHSLNTAMKKLRQALDDSAEHPQFIETLPRVGYRLIGGKQAGPPADARLVRRPRWRLIALAATLAVLATAAGVLLRPIRPFRADGASLKISRLTALGNVVSAVISRDGKFVVNGVNDQGRSSLWLLQIGTTQAIPLGPPTNTIAYYSAQFTPDGKFVYYAVHDPELPERKLYRMPSLGGDSTEVLSSVQSGKVAFSPDGSKMAYLRPGFPTPQESAVLIANPDGSDSRVIATRRQPEFFAPVFFSAPSWSPDGQWIAVSTRRIRGEPVAELMVMRPDGSEQTRISGDRWLFIGQTEWLPDMSGLVAVAADQRPTALSQVWLFPYPRGEPRRITNDLLGHRSVSLSADGSLLVTVAGETDSSVWRVPLTPGGGEVKLTHFKDDGLMGLDGAPNGEVVYASPRGSPFDLYRIDAQGKTRRIPLLDGKPNVFPAVSRRGNLVFQTSEGLHTSRLDGSQLRRLASGFFPTFMPDGEFVIFQERSRGHVVLFKVPLQGGPEVKLTDYPAWLAKVSPDGRHIAAFCVPPGEATRLCLISIDGGLPIKHFPFQPQNSDDLDWAPDGKGIFITGPSGDQANIYLQPLDGSRPTRVTNLEELPIDRFAVAQDGKSLLVARGRNTRDALLITGFR
jgi:Tol biopolymer transport system component/DNA-binding winged helix-turn-helix (wHTH) protein